MNMLRLVAATIVVVAFCPIFGEGNASADADSLSDFLGAQEVSTGEARRAQATGARAITLNPAGLSLMRQYVFEGSYGFRPDDGASSIAVSACDSTVPIPGCYYYNYFAVKPEIDGTQMRRRVHQWGWAASRVLSQRLVIGTNVKYFDYNSDLMGESDASGFAIDTGLIVRATKMVNIALVGYNVLAENTPQYPLAVGTGLSVAPSGSLSLEIDGVWNLDRDKGEKSGRYGGGAEFFLRAADRRSGYPIRGGVVHETLDGATYASGGLGFINPKLGIDIAARRQVRGGDELMILGSIRLFGAQGK